MINTAELYQRAWLLLLYMLAGVLLRRVKLMDASLVKQLSRLNFRAFMPVLVIESMWSNSVAGLSAGVFLYECVFVCVLIVLAGKLLQKQENTNRAIYIQSLFRGNIQTFSVAILPAIPAQWRAAALINAVLVSAAFNVPSMMLFHTERKGAVKRILKTPVIVAAVVGMLLMVSSVPQPEVIKPFMQGIGTIIVPLSFICTGASLEFAQIRKNCKEVLLCSFARLFLIPAAGFAVAILLGFGSTEFMLILPFLVSPCGSACHTIACDAGADGSLAASIVAATQTAAPFTMMAWFQIVGLLAGK